MGEGPEWLLLFRTGVLRFGFDVDAVQRIIPVCEMKPLPGAPASVRGVVVISDALVPVVDPLVPFKVALSDPSASALGLAGRFVMVQTSRRLLAIIADEVDGVRHGSDLEFMPDESLPVTISELKGISVGSDGLVYVSDPERLISDAGEIELQAVLAELADARQ